MGEMTVEGKERRHVKNRIGVSTACLLMAGMAMLVFSGCSGGGSSSKKTDGPPPIDIKVTKVEQYSKLATKIADGQYLVVSLHIKNNSNDTQSLLPSNFLIQNITNDKAQQYTQPNEPQMGGAFTQAYGMDKHDKLLDNQPTAVHPRMSVDRFIVYGLSNDAKLDGYQIYYKPFDITVPLVTSDTEIVDHRDDTGE